MQAGDAPWHFGRTLHNASGNSSAITSVVINIIYFADGATVTKPQNTSKLIGKDGWVAWNQGLKLLLH